MLFQIAIKDSEYVVDYFQAATLTEAVKYFDKWIAARKFEESWAYNYKYPKSAGFGPLAARRLLTVRTV